MKRLLLLLFLLVAAPVNAEVATVPSGLCVTTEPLLWETDQGRFMITVNVCNPQEEPLDVTRGHVENAVAFAYARVRKEKADGGSWPNKNPLIVFLSGTFNYFITFDRVEQGA